MMTDRNDTPATPSPSMENLMREAMSSVEPPARLHGQILAAVAKEKRRCRRLSLYRRCGVIAAAVLILVPAVTMPFFRQAQDSAPAEGEVLQGNVADTLVPEEADTAEDIKVLFSATEEQPAFATRPAQGTTYASCETTAATDDACCDALLPESAGEPAYYAVLRELVGAEAFALWLSSYEGDPTTAEAKAAAYAYFDLDE